MSTQLHGERATAAAGGLHVRVVELETRAVEPLDVIHLGAEEVHQAHLVHDELDAVRVEDLVAVLRIVEIKVVREPGAPAPDHAHAQPHGGLDALSLADFFHFFGSHRTQIDHGCPSYAQI